MPAPGAVPQAPKIQAGRTCHAGGAAEKVEIFYLEREIAVKRRSHYA